MTKFSRLISFGMTFLIFLLGMYSFPCSTIAQSEQVWSNIIEKCKHGLHHQPNGPMAAMLFCEDAVGTYLGLIYYDVMEQPAPADFLRRLNENEKSTFYKIWSLGNRMWQEPIRKHKDF